MQRGNLRTDPLLLKSSQGFNTGQFKTDFCDKKIFIHFQNTEFFVAYLQKNVCEIMELFQLVAQLCSLRTALAIPGLVITSGVLVKKNKETNFT